jgi:hypothetical protein
MLYWLDSFTQCLMFFFYQGRANGLARHSQQADITCLSQIC